VVVEKGGAAKGKGTGERVRADPQERKPLCGTNGGFPEKKKSAHAARVGST